MLHAISMNGELQIWLLLVVSSSLLKQAYPSSLEEVVDLVPQPVALHHSPVGDQPGREGRETIMRGKRCKRSRKDEKDTRRRRRRKRKWRMRNRDPAITAYLCCIFLQYLDKIGHGKVQDVVSPRQLQNDIWSK